MARKKPEKGSRFTIMCHDIDTFHLRFKNVVITDIGRSILLLDQLDQALDISSKSNQIDAMPWEGFPHYRPFVRKPPPMIFGFPSHGDCNELIFFIY